MEVTILSPRLRSNIWSYKYAAAGYEYYAPELFEEPHQ